MGNGLFGIDKEFVIKNSGVRSVFTPHIPINQEKHFFGREDEASRFVSVINTPGQHILVYGDRGVGKTSLAKTSCKVLLPMIMGVKFIEKRCDSQDTFSTIIKEALKAFDIDVSMRERTLSHNEGGDASIAFGIGKAGVNSKRETKTVYSSDINIDSPSWVAGKLKDKKGIFLVDEADAITSASDKHKLAELIKLLSDFNSEFKLVVVGIAKTGSELTAGHPSVERCLKEVQLKRMTDDGIRQIILNGFKEVNIIPSDEVTDKIVDISAGLPHFTHLICLKCAEQAVVDKVRHLGIDILKHALVDSVKDSENAIKDSYDSCLRSFSKPSEYKVLLLAAAYCKTPEFRSSELKEKLELRFNIEVQSTLISRRLSSLIDKAHSPILERSGRGCFRFIDPRMPSFVKMASGIENGT
ncbi:AAA family ATPase [Aeromonas rivipollensis]